MITRSSRDDCTSHPTQAFEGPRCVRVTEPFRGPSVDLPSFQGPSCSEDSSNMLGPRRT